MKRTRNKYHYAVRCAKRNAEEINSNILLEAAKRGDTDLMNELKKYRNSKNKSTIRPEVVENADNPDDIVDKFRNVYNTLYNSNTSNMEEIKELLTLNEEDCLEVKKITGKIVKQAAAKMKPGKNDVTGSFSSEALLNAPDNVFDAIARIFRSYLIHVVA